LLILVNPMIPAPGETPGEWWANTDQREARRANDIRDGRDPDAEFDVFTMFLHDLSPAELALAGSNAREESDAAFAMPWTLPAWPDVPTRVISGREDRCFPVDFQRRVSEERLGVTPEVMPGGHLVALSRASELVDRMLARQ
jgi:pimeloyl-ACP methyl ester carboxylesterase